MILGDSGPAGLQQFEEVPEGTANVARIRHLLIRFDMEKNEEQLVYAPGVLLAYEVHVYLLTATARGQDKMEQPVLQTAGDGTVFASPVLEALGEKCVFKPTLGVHPLFFFGAVAAIISIVVLTHPLLVARRFWWKLGLRLLHRLHLLRLHGLHLPHGRHHLHLRHDHLGHVLKPWHHDLLRLLALAAMARHLDLCERIVGRNAHEHSWSEPCDSRPQTCSKNNK